MVRLKAFVDISADSDTFIFQFLMVRLKDMRYTAVDEPQYLFQFLMVRLKVGTKLKSVQFNVISIPYGAIKRTKTVKLLR